jgi:hypothetical protein
MREHRIHPQQIATSPQAAARFESVQASDNYRNLFEMPVLFYALALYLFVTGQVDQIYVSAAWVFVAFRTLHSIVHSTFNRVSLRFGLYMVSTFALWFIAVRAALAYFAPT